MADAEEEVASGSDEGPYVPKKIWIYGINDHLVPDVAAEAAKYETTGDFTKDFCALCEQVGVVGHSVLARPALAEGTQLIVSSQFVDRVSMEIFAKLANKSALEVVRFSSCGLDQEMVQWVTESCSDCNVRTLHLDWNPLEVALEPIDWADGSVTPRRLDNLESDRRYKQEARDIRLLDREIMKRFGSVESAMETLFAELGELDEDARAAAPEENRMQWLPLEAFCRGLRLIGIPTEEVEDTMNVFDGALHGRGDGGVMVNQVPSILEGTRPLTEEDIARAKEELGDGFGEAQEVEDPLKDEIGLQFAAFLTGCLENCSFRACHLSISEVPCIAKALGESLHIQQLNLWNNRIDDEAAALLATALTENHTLQYLGLGRNRVTMLGLKAIAGVCGLLLRDDTEEAAASSAASVAACQERQKAQEAAKAAVAKTGPPAPTDPEGRPRYVGDQMHADQLLEVMLPPPPPPPAPPREEGEAGEGGEAPAGEAGEAAAEEVEEPQPIPAKVWYRNTQLRTLDLSHNEVRDSAAVAAVSAWGYRAPTLILRGNPVGDEEEREPIPEPAPRPELSDLVIGWQVIL